MCVGLSGDIGTEAPGLNYTDLETSKWGGVRVACGHLSVSVRYERGNVIGSSNRCQVSAGKWKVLRPEQKRAQVYMDGYA